MNTYDCEPTLTDTQVLEFCQDGFLMLEGVVPNEINRKAFQYLEEHTEHACSVGSIDGVIENVLLNPHATGAIRSLLGKNFTVPPDLYGPGNQIKCPMPAGPWHVDGGAVFSPQLDCLQVFYIPQDTPRELGPTDVLPGSHFLIADGIPSMAHYGSIRGAVSTTGPAGSIFLTAYPMWHRRGASTAKGVRNLLKYSYKRTVPPERDWIREPDFNLRRAKGAPPRLKFHREHQRAIYDAAEMFYWLCGKHSEYHSTSRNNFPVHHAS